MSTYEAITLLLTGAIAISTAVYTYYSHRLWKSTRAATDIARFNSLLTFVMTLIQEGDKRRVADPQGAAMYDQVTAIIVELVLPRILSDIDLKKTPEVRDYLNRIDGLMRAHGFDTSAPFFRTLIEKAERK